MNYVIDTDISLFATKGKYGLKEKFLEIGFQNCWLSEITKAELLFSVGNSGYIERNTPVIDAYLAKFAILPISNALMLYAEEKAYLQQKGQLLADFDLLIGTTAIYYGLTLITHNTRHFSRLRNIRLEDWTS